jgi:cell division protein FtsI (penicillin-binding protein 3)
MKPAVHKRMHALVIASLLFGFYTVLASRLMHVQITGQEDAVVEQQRLSARSDHRLGRALFERGRRGRILDCNGAVLATGYQSFRLLVDPNADYKPPRTVARTTLEERADLLLEELERLGIRLPPAERADVYARCTQTEWESDGVGGSGQKAGRPIRSRLLLNGLRTHQRRQIQSAMQAHAINNFFFEVATTRVYPEGALTGELIGFVGGSDVTSEPKGQAGLELSFDQQLAGYPGRYVCEKDGRSAELDVEGYWVEEPDDGADIVLTLDVRIQRFLYEALRKVYTQYRRASPGLVVVGVVLDTRTNHVLAMKNFPDYSPSEVKSSPRGRFDMNRTLIHGVASSWEPGSTLKPFIAARFLEAGVVSWSDVFDTGRGPHNFYYGSGGARPVSDAHPNGVLTFREVITKSSNIGMGMVGVQRFGLERIYKAVDSFGFRERPGSCLPREVGGYYLKKSDTTLLQGGLSMTFGHAIQMSPLSLASKFAVFGTGGVYTPPVLVRYLECDGERYENARPAVRYVPRRIADEMREALVESVRTGTAKSLEGLPWTVAAKTGTAQVLAPQHMLGSYNSSMIALAPAHDPRITVLVFAHGIRGGTYFGGSVAGPAICEVVDQSMRLMNVPADKPDLASGGVSHEN